jgi:hypothetical protein
MRYLPLVALFLLCHCSDDDDRSSSRDRDTTSNVASADPSEESATTSPSDRGASAAASEPADSSRGPRASKLDRPGSLARPPTGAGVPDELRPPR